MINGIIIGLIILCIFVAWIVANGLAASSRFRRLCRERGIQPSEILVSDSGTLILDYVYGASIGIGSPVVWYNPPINPANDSSDIISERSKIVIVSPTKLNLEILRSLFPGVRIIESTTL